MNKGDRSKFSEDKCKLPKQMTISPAVLGIKNSYGVKLSLNVTSQKKRELLCKLEEWRKARDEKLAASILRRQAENLKENSVSLLKNKTNKSYNLNRNSSMQKTQNEENVFDRLYRNSTKIKKTEVKELYNNPQRSSNSNLELQANLETKKQEIPSKGAENFVSPKGIFVDKNCLHSGISETQTVDDDSAREPQSQHSSEIVSDQFYDKKTENLYNIPEITFALDSNETLDMINKSAVKNKNKFFKTLEDDEVTKNPLKAYKALSVENLNIPEINIDKQNSNKTVHSLNDSAIQGTHLKREVFHNQQRDVFETKMLGNVPLKKNSKNPLRRSVSMLYRRKLNPDAAIHRAKSENVCILKNSTAEKNFQREPLASEKILNGHKNSKTPSKPTAFDHSTPSYLRKRLEDWLVINGHPLEKYRHLRCFGLSNQQIVKKSPKKLKNIDATRAASLGCVLADDSDKENSNPTVPYSAEAKDIDIENWLKELYRLITKLKYPPGRCEEWLAAIKNKNAACTEMRIYWECLAALDEVTKENLTPAATQSSRSILDDESKDVVGDSLAKLFDKMVIEQDNPSKSKLEKGLDPKNIFKSTVIKFAVQQKQPLKECKKGPENVTPKQQYIATPVRRSSRIRTPSQSHVVSSLHSLTLDVQSNTTFKPNKSLFTEK